MVIREVSTHGGHFILSSTMEALLTEFKIQKYDITSREHEVIDYLLRGYTSKYIAKRLCISQKTVKNHIYNIYQKVGVRSRLEMLHTLKA
jgi:DNA-binding NarL/FixJ family response regulator